MHGGDDPPDPRALLDDWLNADQATVPDKELREALGV